MKILYYTLSATLDDPLPIGKTIRMTATSDQKHGDWVSRGQVGELMAQNKKLRAKMKECRNAIKNAINVLEEEAHGQGSYVKTCELCKLCIRLKKTNKAKIK